jgi:multidrug resistance efflux pump
VPEIAGRVAEVYVEVSADVAKGAPLFKLDSSKREAAFEVAKRNIAEIDARDGHGEGRDRRGRRSRAPMSKRSMS